MATATVSTATVSAATVPVTTICVTVLGGGDRLDHLDATLGGDYFPRRGMER